MQTTASRDDSFPFFSDFFFGFFCIFLYGRFLEMQKSDATFKRVHQEIQTALNGWSANGRWNGILHAGLQDTAPATIFDKIVAKEIPAAVVFEDDKVL